MNYEDGQDACHKLYGHILEFDERTDYKVKLDAIRRK